MTSAKRLGGGDPFEQVQVRSPSPEVRPLHFHVVPLKLQRFTKTMNTDNQNAENVLQAAGICRRRKLPC